MNAAAIKPQSGWYSAKAKDVTIAVIGNEENIAHVEITSAPGMK